MKKIIASEEGSDIILVRRYVPRSKGVARAAPEERR
jgi:hypothetical protein